MLKDPLCEEKRLANVSLARTCLVALGWGYKLTEIGHRNADESHSVDVPAILLTVLVHPVRPLLHAVSSRAQVRDSKVDQLAVKGLV